MSESDKTGYVKLVLLFAVTVSIPVAIYFAVFYTSMDSASFSSFSSAPEEPLWKWELVEQTPNQIRFKAVGVEMPRSDDVLKEVSAHAELLKDGIDVGHVDVSLKIHPDCEILLEVISEDLSNADELIISVAWQCLRTGFFGHGDFSGNFSTMFKMTDGKVIDEKDE
ncbi:hypothetical protein Pla110_10260 [Polystyrenella longa]|uniref:Uncharacterized protein n=1 Tax=Polystyrenella longa TaxID=2528007 RepID=A0A518CJB6_9PLAN|nr:hypothetical protein [Polystyrenella longa]QDU79318.1 hypothetical protein Pla110_10260 [Polystyrenella longa]